MNLHHRRDWPHSIQPSLFGEEHRLISQTAAGNQAYASIDSPHFNNIILWNLAKISSDFSQISHIAGYLLCMHLRITRSFWPHMGIVTICWIISLNNHHPGTHVWQNTFFTRWWAVPIYFCSPSSVKQKKNARIKIGDKARWDMKIKTLHLASSLIFTKAFFFRFMLDRLWKEIG